jgi:hypothetical protein
MRLKRAAIYTVGGASMLAATYGSVGCSAMYGLAPCPDGGYACHEYMPPDAGPDVAVGDAAGGDAAGD